MGLCASFSIAKAFLKQFSGEKGDLEGCAWDSVPPFSLLKPFSSGSVARKEARNGASSKEEQGKTQGREETDHQISEPAGQDGGQQLWGLQERDNEVSLGQGRP